MIVLIQSFSENSFLKTFISKATKWVMSISVDILSHPVVQKERHSCR